MGLFVFEDFIRGVRTNINENKNYEKISLCFEVLQEEGLLQDLLTENQYFYHKGTVAIDSKTEFYFFNKREVIILFLDDERGISIQRNNFEVEKIELNNLSYTKHTVDLAITLRNGVVINLSKEKDSSEKTMNPYFKVIIEIYKYLIN